MTNMFKKTLVAAALASLSSAAFAVDYSTIALVEPDAALGAANSAVVKFSTEERNRIAAATSAANRKYEIATPVYFRTNVTYAAGDIIQIKVTGAQFDTTGTPAIAVRNRDNATTFTAVVPNTVSFIGYEGTDTLNFQVATGGTITVNAELALSGMAFKGETVSDSLTVAYSAKTSGGIAKDNIGTVTSLKFAEFAAQTKFEIKESDILKKKIDVKDGKRTTFTDNTRTEAFVLTYTNDATLQKPATVDRVAFTVSGDLDIKNKDGNAVALADFLVCPGYAGTLAADKASATFVRQDDPLAVITTANITCTFTLPADVEIKAQAFTVSASAQKAGTPVTTLSTFPGLKAGEWKLDGKTVSVPYMVYGGNAEQTIQFNNSSSVDGKIFAVAIRNGQRIDLGEIADLPKNTLVSVNGAVRNAMKAKGIAADSGANFAVGLEFFTTVPDNVSAYTAYQHLKSTNTTRQVVLNEVK